MLKLHGVRISNYYSMVKVALLEKGFDFEEVLARPSQSSDFLAISPVGKIPCLEAREGFLSETDVILEFLEEVHPDIALLPSDAYERGRVRQIMRICQHYIDTPLRPLLGSVLFGAPFSDAAVQAGRPALEKGLAALARVARFQPWLAGDEFTYADIVGYYTTAVASTLARAVYQWDISDAIDGYSSWRQRVAERHFVQQVDGEWRAALQSLKKA